MFENPERVFGFSCSIRNVTGGNFMIKNIVFDMGKVLVEYEPCLLYTSRCV